MTWEKKTFWTFFKIKTEHFSSYSFSRWVKNRCNKTAKIIGKITTAFLHLGLFVLHLKNFVRLNLNLNLGARLRKICVNRLFSSEWDEKESVKNLSHLRYCLKNPSLWSLKSVWFVEVQSYSFHPIAIVNFIYGPFICLIITSLFWCSFKK